MRSRCGCVRASCALEEEARFERRSERGGRAKREGGINDRDGEGARGETRREATASERESESALRIGRREVGRTE